MMFRAFTALILGVALSALAPAQALADKYKLGEHYFAISPAQPSPSDKIEVIEVFSYLCGACAQLQPHVETWKKKLPATVSFNYMPATWSAPWEQVGRAFYAAQALGVLDKTHGAFFQAIHAERQPMNDAQAIANWYAKNGGVSAADFTAAMQSSGVNIKVARTRTQVPRYGVESTPTLVIAGKYRLTGLSAGGWDNALELTDMLIAQEAQNRAQPKTP